MSTFTTDGPVAARVTFGCGQLTISTSDAGSAGATVEALDPDDAQAVALAERAQVRLDGRTLHVDAHQRGWRQSTARLHVRLAVPAGSDVACDAGQLTFLATDPLGAISVRAGDMTMEVGAADSISVSSGRSSVRGGSIGDVTVRAGQASLDLQRTSGTVRVKGGAVTFDLHEVSSGDVVVETAAGNAEVGVASGTTVELDLDTRTGQVRCDIPVEPAAGAAPTAALRLRLKTATGDIAVSRVTAA
jgi:hypothetical protein